MSTPQITVDSAPPSAREMVRIALGLTVVCLLASLILGGFYAWTEPAKARNIAEREQRLIGQLLGLSERATVREVRRYLLWRGNAVESYYLTDRALLRLDATGALIGSEPVPAAIAGAPSTDERDAWVAAQSAAGEQDRFRYAGRFFAGYEGERNAGFVIEGRTIGFKTWIRFFLAIDADFGLRGVEIIEHEEDPGLGAEITEPYFKQQFSGRSFADITTIEVTKDPLPNAWRAALEEAEGADLADWIARHRDDLAAHPQIHAITGATISSVAVNVGIKRALRNFRQRMQLVEAHL